MIGTKFIKKGESVSTRDIGGKAIQLLFKSGMMEGIVVELEPMTGFEGSYSHEGEEMHLVLEGEVEFVVSGETFLCQEGDILWHHSNLEHTIRNPGMAHATYLTVLSPPSINV
jgi:mannose-6-phosphate isomerase-like protein (cupin superfamily)